MGSTEGLGTSQRWSKWNGWGSMIHATSCRKGMVGMDKTKPAWTNNLGVPCLGVTGVRETFTSKVLFSTKLKDLSYHLEFSLSTPGKRRMDLLPDWSHQPATLPRSWWWCIKGPSWSFELACPPTPFPPLTQGSLRTFHPLWTPFVKKTCLGLLTLTSKLLSV